MRYLLQLCGSDGVELLHGLGVEIDGQAITKAKRMPFDPLGAGLAAHGLLASQFRYGQLELVAIQWLVEQPLPFIQQRFQSGAGLISAGGEMPEERRVKTTRRKRY